MAIEAFLQDLYPPNLFLETSTYDDNTLHPNFSFNSLISQDILLNDSSYEAITNNYNNNYNNYYSNIPPSFLSDPALVTTDYNIPTTTTEFVDNNEEQMWASVGPNNVSYSTSPEGGCESYEAAAAAAAVVVNRPTRRRARPRKNKEDIENQRMTHIAVERNRRKQMNGYLALLRSLMPHSYVQRGDQASIVGGAINFVKELEQNLQCLSSKKHNNNNNNNSELPFGEFLTFPQYSTVESGASTSTSDNKAAVLSHRDGAVADVEVTMVESHALVKIRSKRPPKQLSKLVTGLQGLKLTVLHLNLAKVDGVALYSFNLKVEDESKLSSVDDIAGAVHHLLCMMQEETNINS